MMDILLPDKTIGYTKEYLNYPSLILREIKSCTLLSQGAKHCWELLFDLSKFDSHRTISICITSLEGLLNKSYRTIQRYIEQLAKSGFVQVKENYDDYGRVENTYTVLVPSSIADKVENSNKKVFIKPENMASKPQNPQYDSFVQGNKELNININNCYHDAKNEKEALAVESISQSEEPVLIPDAEIVEYYPAKEKPTSLGKAVLRHCLKQKASFEKVIGEKLTVAQQALIKQVIAFWTSMKYISSPQECFGWIQSAILSEKAFSNCGNNFLQKMNVIIKTIREKRFSRPYSLRYQESASCEPQPEKQNLSPAVSHAITQLFKPERRESLADRLKQERLSHLQAQISVCEERIAAEKDERAKTGFYSLIESLMIKMQEVQYA